MIHRSAPTVFTYSALAVATLAFKKPQKHGRSPVELCVIALTDSRPVCVGPTCTCPEPASAADAARAPPPVAHALARGGASRRRGREARALPMVRADGGGGGGGGAAAVAARGAAGRQARVGAQGHPRAPPVAEPPRLALRPGRDLVDAMVMVRAAAVRAGCIDCERGR